MCVLAVIKLWNVKTNECMGTFDGAHSEKIWAMSLFDGDRQMVSAGADATVAVWADVTRAEEAAAAAESAARTVKDQRLANALRRSDWKAAVGLALELRHPRRLLTVFEKLIERDSTSAAAAADDDADGDGDAPADSKSDGLMREIISALTPADLTYEHPMRSVGASQRLS
jgi:U3 small nucleolar RNA-associated protein 13